MSGEQDGQNDPWKRIERFLAANREQLKRQGGVYARSDASTHTVRFRDHSGEKMIHRGFAIGRDPEIVERTRQTIQQWQQHFEEQHTLKDEVAETLAGLVDFADLGKRQKRRVKGVIRDRVERGRTVDAFYLALRVDSIPRSRTGRPRKGERWGTAGRETQGSYPGWDRERGRPFEVVYDEKGNREIVYGPVPEDDGVFEL